MADSVFNPTLGPARSTLSDADAETIARLEEVGVLVADERRARSSYFDGRFLAARDLTREQNYALVRQADLSRAGGSGVVRGLDVRLAGPSTLAIAAGAGSTGTGELVSLSRPLTVALGNIPDLQRLDLSEGVAPLPAADPAKRSGVFVLGLRPVEYSKNPTTAYPTTVFGKRGQQAGDIQEAVALVLAPFEDEASANADAGRRRSELARKVFFEGGAVTLSPELLPLAMMLLDRGVVRWLDPYLVRREIAADRSSVLGLSLVSRALREAHFLQYDAQLREALSERQAAGRARFPATDLFTVLPAVGRMPAAAIEAADFTQFWFPPEITVELSVVSDHEIGALVEQQLALPPIDLRGRAEDLDFTKIQVLIPLSLAAIAQLRLDTSPRRIGPFIPALAAKRRPLDILNALVRDSALARGDVIGVDTPAQARQRTIDAAWKRALALSANSLLWYVRARTLELGAAALTELKDSKDAPDKTAKEGKETKEAKETKDSKDAKETKETKENKDGKDTKDAAKETKEEAKDTKDGTKDTKEASKDTKDAKDGTKETKEASKDSKDSKDATKETKEASKDTKDNKDATKETKEASKDTKDTKDGTKETKEASKDNKDNKDATKEAKEQSKDRKDTLEKVRAADKLAISAEKLAISAEKVQLERVDVLSTGLDRVALDLSVKSASVPTASSAVPAVSRTFIEPAERPAVGDRALSEPTDEEKE